MLEMEASESEGMKICHTTNDCPTPKKCYLCSGKRPLKTCKRRLWSVGNPAPPECAGARQEPPDREKAPPRPQIGFEEFIRLRDAGLLQPGKRHRP